MVTKNEEAAAYRKRRDSSMKDARMWRNRCVLENVEACVRAARMNNHHMVLSKKEIIH